MSKYEKLDALILAKIGGSPISFSAMNTDDVAHESERIAKIEGMLRTRGEVVGWRISTVASHG